MKRLVITSALILSFASPLMAQQPVPSLPHMVDADVPTPVAAALIAAMAQQQQAVAGMQTVQVQVMMELQDIMNALREIQAAQQNARVAGGSK